MWRLGAGCASAAALAVERALAGGDFGDGAVEARRGIAGGMVRVHRWRHHLRMHLRRRIIAAAWLRSGGAIMRGT